MLGPAVVIAANGLGVPVRPVTSGAPLVTVAANGIGVPIVISDLGAPFILSSSTVATTFNERNENG